MSKLVLSDIRKSYALGSESVAAVKGVSLKFRENEFVCILGPSGCGKTTLLNVIGGLDRYDSGNLVINGLSTKRFKDSDWDAYRNRSIGFVFQNYNLIAHQSVLQNVEISMTLSGVSAAARKKRAAAALSAVGLADQADKKPTQMSGGQMQRAAIARALVNNPDIILADEPTGALDSHTSIQVMELLKEISKTRLVIMVTHNSKLAEKYSDRVIRMLDGEIESDSNPVSDTEDWQEHEPQKHNKAHKTSMSVKTASGLSFKNLLTKKGRTALTSFAGSIGIIGVALVLALSGGLSTYMDSMQADALAGFPITISTAAQSAIDAFAAGGGFDTAEEGEKFVEDNILYSYSRNESTTLHTNILTDDYFDYIGKMEEKLPEAVSNISYTRGVEMNILAKGGETAVLFSGAQETGGQMQPGAGFGGNGQGSSYWQEMPENQDFILSLYDLIGEGSRMPQNTNEVLLVVDEYNRIDEAFFEMLGITSKDNYKLTDFIGRELLSVIANDDYYSKSNGLYAAASASQYENLYENGVKLTVTGILRIKENAASSYFSEGLVYTPALTKLVVESAESSEIALAQADSNKNVITGVGFADESAKKKTLLTLGADTTPTGINIYPKDFDSKDAIKEYLNAYNTKKAEADQVVFSDMAESISNIMGTTLNTVSYVLMGFAAISLLVSTIMIAVITYVSVIERTKEIGILRAVGARKKDISRVFNAEALLIGLISGVLGIGISYLLIIPINSLIEIVLDVGSLAYLNPVYAAALILGSMALTLIAGFIPSKIAAKKDPVEALRTE